MSMFLKPAQLREMTGARRRSLQIQWLEERGLAWERTHRGGLIVMTSAVNRLFRAPDDEEDKETSCNSCRPPK